MLNKELVSLLNQQVNKEWYSAYFYLDIYAYYTDKNLDGFANWFHIQAQEERDHAMLFVQYLLNNGEKVDFQDIKASGFSYEGFREPLTATYEHELTVTASINNIYAEAYSLKDFRTMQFLDWFVKEQGEEEKNSDGLVKRFDLFGNDPKSLYSLDAELGARIYMPPSLVL